MFVATGVLEGTSLKVPPGALSEDVTIQIFAGAISLIPGLTEIGPPALFTPEGLQFSEKVEMTLPFDVSQVPANTPSTNFFVAIRDRAGLVSSEPVGSVDVANGRATLEVDHFSTYWVDIITVQVLDPTQYFPLNDGDTYVYSNGVTIFVQQVSNEPNLGGRTVMKVNLGILGRDSGIYLRREGTINSAGTYDGQTSQQIDDAPIVFLPQQTELGNPTFSDGDFRGYEPYGASTPTYTGNHTVSVTVDAHTEVTTPLRTFSDAIAVLYEEVWRRSTGAQGSSSERIWFAKDVGPVILELEGLPEGRLISATVAGNPITSN